jgi:RNA polymerase sigma-70 factor (ECF subfamily)
LEELELIELAKKGDQEAFDQLIDLFGDRIFTEAYYLMGNREDAMDVSQLVFLRIFLGIKRFKGESKLSTWIYRITINTALRELKKRSRKPPLDDSEDVDPQDEVIRHDEQKIALKALNRLPQQYRAIIVMRELNDMSFKDIADSLGISVNLAKVRAFRAKQKFKTIVEEIENGK